MNMAPGAIQPPLYQQPAPYMAPPVMPQRPVAPRPPPGYTPPTGYRPPTLASPTTKAKTTKKAPLAKIATVAKSSSTKKPSSYRPPSSKTSTKKSTGSVQSQVARLESNDRRQDLRLGNLERDVGMLPDTIEGGGIADLTPFGKTYVVRPGDTLWTVASRHGVSVNALRSANRMDDVDVGIGQSLIIPSGESYTTPRSSFTGVYVVKSADSFTRIARDHGITTDALARANPSAYPDRLLIGERLLVPGGKGRTGGTSNHTITTTTSASHTVKRGESLGGIAKKYGVSTSTLARTNKLRNANLIEVGDRLVIPGVKTSRSIPSQLAFADADTQPLADFRIPEPPTPPVKPEPIAPLPPINATAETAGTGTSSRPRGVVGYRMERGDSIDSVANMFSTTPENIRALNKFSADKVLKEGNELYVPSVGAVSVN